MKELFVTVLRGENKIGENLIEIADKKSKILVECGVALNPTIESNKIENQVIKKHYDAIIISHSHFDHAGLLKKAVNAKQIYMGKSTYELLCYMNAICEKNKSKVMLFENEKSFLINEIEIKAHLCDHSAYDSYMIEVRKGAERILYTGDFRSNGRKSFNALLERLPTEIDVLITEATNANEHNFTERYVEERALEIMKKHNKVFFLQSGLNIDRLVSFYRASKRSNKPFIMGLGSAEISRIGDSIPNPQGFSDCYTYLKSRANKLEYTSSKDKYKQKLIGRGQISVMEKFSMQVSSGMGEYLEKLNALSDLKGSALIYSMWDGYKLHKSVNEFLQTTEKLGIEIIDLHVSGHADKWAQKMLVDRVKPQMVITVHKECKTLKSLENVTVIDIETDGLNYDPSKGEVDSIIKIEAIKIKDGKIAETFETFVNNGKKLSQAIEALTGVTNDNLQDAPSINDALINLYFFSYGTHLAFYNSSFTGGFLNYHSRHLKIFFNGEGDIYEIAKKHLKNKIKRFRLKELKEFYHLEGKDIECKAKILIELMNGNKSC